MREKLKILNYSTDDLLALRKTHRVKHEIRFLAILYVSQGLHPRDAAKKLLLLSYNQIRRWVHRFNEEGFAGLEGKPKTGRVPRLSDAQVEKLKLLILNESPESYGFNSGTWTAALLRDWVEKHWGVILKLNSFYPILRKRAGLSFQKSKGFYPEAKDRTEAEVLLKKN